MLKQPLKTHVFHTVIVGSGAAAYNAADSLYDLGVTDLAIVTEGRCMGTSRNTGSDKQTYYKLSLSGDEPDSVYRMAKALFAGGSMNGDTALVEAAVSPRSFFKLVQLGVPFPSDGYGQYAGYKTDHDPLNRATSCGPLTSKIMTEQLEQAVMKKRIPLFDGYRVIRLITIPDEKGEIQVAGALSLYTDANGIDAHLVLFRFHNIIYATGGPAGIYGCSVYPESQTGAHGAALEIGVKGNNVIEWQYGIASIGFRWNLSGTYQQVIPRYISTDANGSDAREFLGEYFKTPQDALTAVFLKGYQWPFDPGKLGSAGSSLVDLAVYTEIKEKGRRVFLDFQENSAMAGKDGIFDFSMVSEETYRYLEKSDVLFGTPIERLKKMNHPAYDLYRSYGIDLENDRLEIAVCAQHNNGGLQVDRWWRSNVKNLFIAGEAAATLGVYRPGGTALNSTQVGSLRAAQYIAGHQGEQTADETAFAARSQEEIRWITQVCEELYKQAEKKQNPLALRAVYQKEMDGCGGFIRNQSALRKQISRVRGYLEHFTAETLVENGRDLKDAWINRDILITQLVYLVGMEQYIVDGGYSRGSYLILNENNEPVCDNGGQRFTQKVQEISYDPVRNNAVVSYQPVRPLPLPEVWFETVYNEVIKNNEKIRKH